MSSTNMAVVDGYLGKDSELKFANSGMAFLNFSVAVKSQRKSGEQWIDHTDWVDCKAIGKRAEGLAKILKKGAFCVVSGSLSQERWEDKDGGKRSKIVLFAENVSLGPKPAGGGERGRHSGDHGGSESDHGPGAADFDDLPFNRIGDIG